MRSNSRVGQLLWQLMAAGALTVAACGSKQPGADAAAMTGGGGMATPSASGGTAAPSSAGGSGGNSTATSGAPGGASAGRPSAGMMAVAAGGSGPGAAAGGGGEAASAGMGAEPGAGAGGSTPAAGGGVQCPELKPTTTEARLHMHHIHFNTQDPAAGVAFVQKYFDATPFDYCKDAAGAATPAAKTDRAYFLYSKVDAPPSNMRLNRLAHVGYINADVAGELRRLLDLDVPLADSTVCATAAMGTPCNTATVQWFYVDMPESARFEIATGPGPATSGFGHIHLVAPDYSFFQTVLGDALQDPNGSPHVDQVNMVASGRTGILDTTITYEDTRGAAIDHVGFSTGDLEGTLARIEAAGVKIEEPISFKAEYGFRSFMVRSEEGIWLEILEGDGFKP
jgi:predicted enzyme related to lactoylglutathione lyase